MKHDVQKILKALKRRYFFDRFLWESFEIVLFLGVVIWCSLSVENENNWTLFEIGRIVLVATLYIGWQFVRYYLYKDSKNVYVDIYVMVDENDKEVEHGNFMTLKKVENGVIHVFEGDFDMELLKHAIHTRIQSQRTVFVKHKVKVNEKMVMVNEKITFLIRPEVFLKLFKDGQRDFYDHVYVEKVNQKLNELFADISFENLTEAKERIRQIIFDNLVVLEECEVKVVDCEVNSFSFNV